MKNNELNHETYAQAMKSCEEAIDSSNEINSLVDMCHGLAKEAGWWSDLETGECAIESRNIPEILCLIHSEISEAMEGHRKNLMDDKLPNRKMLEVELGDAVIRIFDLAGALNMDLGGAITEKLIYNIDREDHKREHRQGVNGKTF